MTTPTQQKYARCRGYAPTRTTTAAVAWLTIQEYSQSFRLETLQPVTTHLPQIGTIFYTKSW